MTLGVPTLCRYDLLDVMLRSAATGAVAPTRYIIVDNGGGYGRARAEQSIGMPACIELVEPGRNWGVARSWNHMLERAAQQPVVIANDDVVFGRDTFAEMASAAADALFVSGDGWCLFAQHPECTRRVGWYDEHFWPAYYEDTDYHMRLHLAGIVPVRPLSQPVQHTGWSTTRGLGNPPWLAEHLERNRQYFVRKWGADSVAAATFQEPFNGQRPHGWHERVAP